MHKEVLTQTRIMMIYGIRLIVVGLVQVLWALFIDHDPAWFAVGMGTILIGIMFLF